MKTKKDLQLSDTLRNLFGLEPKHVDGVFAGNVIYWRNQLYRLIFGCFDFEGLPHGWDKDYMLTHLFMEGYFTITDTEMGVLPLACGYSGINVFSHPTTVIVNNPVLGSFERTIEKDCVLVKLEYSYHGLDDIVQRTATMLSMCDSSISVNLMNSKVAFIGFAEDKAQAQAMQCMYDMIAEGEPAVFVRRSQLQREDIYYNHVKNQFVADDIQLVQRKILDQFLTAIGIQNANTDKRERLITDEVKSNSVEVEASCEHWLDTVNDCLIKANSMYDLNLKFIRREFIKDLDYSFNKGGDDNEER